MLTKFILTITLISVSLVAVKATSAAPHQEACPQICPANYDPLCATDGRIYKEFSNTCELNASNCRLERSSLKTYVTTLMDWCRTELVENADNLLVKLNNLDLTKPECLKPCAMIYEPVCISNGKYRTLAGNKCLMEIINCALGNQNAFKIIQNQSC